mmetsp:Transcript_45279/g.73742  ORF Transcript_45279/g.73742 Transcript_45279/m.73742 type:complete len:511 (-) Transcript_45279:181-1713(-)
MATRTFFYGDSSSGHAPQGPCTEDDLCDAWCEGDINESTLVWTEGLEEWKPLSNFSELIERFKKAEAGDDPISAGESSPAAKFDSGYDAEQAKGRPIGVDVDEMSYVPVDDEQKKIQEAYQKYLIETAVDSDDQSSSSEDEGKSGKKRKAAEGQKSGTANESASMDAKKAKLSKEPANDAKKAKSSKEAKLSEGQSNDAEKTKPTEGASVTSEPSKAPQDANSTMSVQQDAAKLEKKKKKKKKKGEKWVSAKINTYVYVSGLPDDITSDEIVEHFSKCGILKPDEETGKPKIKLYMDSNGVPKGDARVAYLKEPSVDLAVSILDGSEIRPGINISVTKAVFQQKGEAYVKKDLPKRPKGKAKPKFDTEKVLSWDDGIDDGRGLRIVILKNLFHPSELETTPELSGELREDLEMECAKFGEVEKITIFEKHPQGVVAVKFKQSASAEDCISIMNLRWFGGRQITAEYFDGKTNYKMETFKPTEAIEAEENARIEEFGRWLEEGGDKEVAGE